MSDDLVKQAMAELADVVRCRCNEAYTGRGLRDPDCQCDSAEAVKVVADRIEELEAKLKEAMIGVPLTAEQADALGLVTMILDDIDWDDELEAKLKEAMALVGIIF